MIAMRYVPRISLSSLLCKKCHILIVTTWNRNYLHINIVNPNNNKDEISESHRNTAIPELPEPPTNCCFSGCANCVWIKYAEDLSMLFSDAEDKIKNIILSKIDDPNMKAFLLMELRSIKFKK